MPEIGQTILHYRIIEKIGQGGMGEVYQAKDQKLGRDVAIKVLPEEFAKDTDRVARFQREAKLLASLNHPNIAAIHGLEESGGTSFLILELVQGETLANRLKRGPIPVEESLKLALQIAEALEAAHEKGVIHRDLKPANVKITPEGKVKILDFGLAKAFQGETPAADASKSPTLTDQMTRPGVILGTAAYMSPEQAKGKPVDKRTDIWAFGCILFECLTGKRAFRGDSVTEVMAKILEAEPDWTQLPANTPAIVRSLLRRCLQKDPGRRFHHIVDARVEMLEGLSQPADAIPVARQFSLLWLSSIGAAILVIGVLIGLLVMKYLKPAASPTSQPVVRFPVKVEPGHCLSGVHWWGPPTRTAMAISGDGSFMVYSAVKEDAGPQDKSRLYLRG